MTVNRSGEKIVAANPGTNADVRLEPDGTGKVRATAEIEAGGTATGQSKIQGGMVVNEAGGSASSDNFRAETANNANAFEVDAANDRVSLGVALKLPVLAGAPGTLVAGMLWAESDGVHYYDGTTEYTLDMTAV